MPETSSIPGLRDLWRLTLGDPRVCVAVLDGPAVLDHPCLRGANVRRLRSYWLDDGADVEDGLVEHATHVCSVLFSPHDTGRPGPRAVLSRPEYPGSNRGHDRCL